jgi:hypothetical protein
MTEKNQESEVKVYLTEREIDGHKYGDEICARSFEEAEELAKRLGGKLLGSLEAAQCANCGNVIRGSGDAPLSPDEWPDDAIREIP